MLGRYSLWGVGCSGIGGVASSTAGQVIPLLHYSGSPSVACRIQPEFRTRYRRCSGLHLPCQSSLFPPPQLLLNAIAQLPPFPECPVPSQASCPCHCICSLPGLPFPHTQQVAGSGTPFPVLLPSPSSPFPSPVEQGYLFLTSVALFFPQVRHPFLLSPSLSPSLLISSFPSSFHLFTPSFFYHLFIKHLLYTSHFWRMKVEEDKVFSSWSSLSRARGRQKLKAHSYQMFLQVQCCIVHSAFTISLNQHCNPTR